MCSWTGGQNTGMRMRIHFIAAWQFPTAHRLWWHFQNGASWSLRLPFISGHCAGSQWYIPTLLVRRAPWFVLLQILCNSQQPVEKCRAHFTKRLHQSQMDKYVQISMTIIWSTLSWITERTGKVGWKLGTQVIMRKNIAQNKRHIIIPLVERENKARVIRGSTSTTQPWLRWRGPKISQHILTTVSSPYH